MQQAPTYSLGPLPWSEETLVAAVYHDFKKAQEWIEEHPGFAINEGVESLDAVLRIFNDSATAFGNELGVFHRESQSGDLFRRTHRLELKGFEDRFRQLLYVFCSSAMSLVDQTRLLCQQIEIPGYTEYVKAAFAGNPMRRFIQELRVDVVHINLHRPEWQVSYEFGEGKERTSKFLLWPKQLTRANKYSAEARMYLGSTATAST